MWLIWYLSLLLILTSLPSGLMANSIDFAHLTLRCSRSQGGSFFTGFIAPVLPSFLWIQLFPWESVGGRERQGCLCMVIWRRSYVCTREWKSAVCSKGENIVNVWMRSAAGYSGSRAVILHKHRKSVGEDDLQAQRAREKDCGWDPAELRHPDCSLFRFLIWWV